MTNGIRISQLPSISVLTSDDVFVVNDGNAATRKITYASVITNLLSGDAIGNGQLTIQGSDGTIVGTFTANSSSDVTITLPDGGLVDSVNGKTGAVVLDADDIDDTLTIHKFVTAAQITSIGTAVQPGDNVSVLTNDAQYVTTAGVPTNNNQLTNGAGYITIADVPTNNNQLTNGAGYITIADVPTNNNQLTNGAGYITIADVPTNNNELTNGAGYITSVDNLDDIGDVAVAGATANQYLSFDGTNWVAQTFSVDDNLNPKGSIDCTTDAAPAAVAGDYYFNTGDGTALNSWTGLTDVVDGDRVVYTNNNEWQIFGNINSSGGIGLDDFSVTKETASGGGDLTYNNSSGVFTYTPPALGTAAATDADAYATAAQGAKADSALQDASAFATAAQGDKADSALQDASAFATATQGDTADTAVQPGDLATVATTGSYNDLTDIPISGATECPIHQIEFINGDSDDTDINVIQESWEFDDYEDYFRMPYDSAFKKVGAEVKFRTAPGAEWVEKEITAWQYYTSPELVGEYISFQVDGINSNWTEASVVDCGPVKDGTLHIRNGRGRELTTFSANQEGDSILMVPSSATMMDGCDAPHTMNWLHIKNVRGGKLRIVNHDSTFVSLEVLNVGNNYAYSNFAREQKRYGSALMVYGNESIGDNAGTGYYQGKPIRAFMYGDATFIGQPLEPSNNGDPNYGAGRDWIEAQGQNPDNWFGTGDRQTNNRDHEDSCCILPTCLMKNASGNDVEVPNNFEYLIYFTGDISDNPASFLQGEDGCTYDLGPLTYTVNAKYLYRFFYSGTAPHLGFRFMQTPTCEKFKEMFYSCKNLGFAPELVFWDTSSGKDFERMFHQQSDFDANVGSWDMTKAENTKQMFEQCTNFTCGGKSRAGEGLDNWQLLSLGQGETDYGSIAGETFHMCYELAHDISSVRVPNITSTDAQNKPVYQFNDHTRVNFDDGGTVRGDESSTAANISGPWDSSHKVARYTYVSANRFTRDPLWGPDRKENGVVVHKGWTPEFSIERRKIWQEYIDWNDQTVADGTRDRYQDEGGGYSDKWDELKAKDDLLCEQYFDPTWGDVKIKSDGSPYRVYDEGNPLADPVEPARAWSENGTTFKVKVEWTKEYFSGTNFQNKWVPSNTSYEWQIISGGDKVSLDSLTTRTPSITFTGNTGEEAVLEFVTTQADDPTVTESFQLRILGADAEPTP